MALSNPFPSAGNRVLRVPTSGAFYSARVGGCGGFLSAVKSAATGGGGGGSTPILRCGTRPLQEPEDPTRVPPPSAQVPMRKHRMPMYAPASPRSPSRFALLKASLLPSKVLRGAGVRAPGGFAQGGSGGWTARGVRAVATDASEGGAAAAAAAGACSRGLSSGSQLRLSGALAAPQAA